MQIDQIYEIKDACERSRPIYSVGDKDDLMLKILVNNLFLNSGFNSSVLSL